MSNPFKKDDENLEKNTEATETEEVAEEVAEKEQEETKSGDNELQKKYDELNSQYIRLAADFDNYRKRQAQERESLLKYGAENTLKKIIEVLDNFERGAKANETVEDCEKVQESFNLVHKQSLRQKVKSLTLTSTRQLCKLLQVNILNTQLLTNCKRDINLKIECLDQV